MNEKLLISFLLRIQAVVNDNDNVCRLDSDFFHAYIHDDSTWDYSNVFWCHFNNFFYILFPFRAMSHQPQHPHHRHQFRYQHRQQTQCRRVLEVHRHVRLHQMAHQVHVAAILDDLCLQTQLQVKQCVPVNTINRLLITKD